MIRIVVGGNETESHRIVGAALQLPAGKKHRWHSRKTAAQPTSPGCRVSIHNPHMNPLKNANQAGRQFQPHTGPGAFRAASLATMAVEVKVHETSPPLIVFLS